MVKKIRLLWLLIPVGLLALHFGAGQDFLARDLAGDPLREAEAAAAEGNWDLAALAYGEALSKLPGGDRAIRQSLSLAQARAQIKAGQMIAGQENLENVLAELEEGPRRDGEVARAVRHELATASYYAAWLMRLEGAAPEEWKPEIHRARQQFRLLAERAEEAGEDGEASAHAEAFKKNLEAAIRLEQMDLTELLAKPLPRDCPSCKNLSQRKRKQCQSRCKGQGKGKGKGKKKKGDARQKIKMQQRGAGLNEREGTGS